MGKKTCSDAHRAKRSRRIKREQVNRAAVARATVFPEHQKEIRDIVADRVPEIGNEIIKEELRPVVRDAITGKVLGAIKTMVGLAPHAIAALERDMQSTDSSTSLRATELWFRYTVGKDLHDPNKENESANMTVNFALPRPTEETVWEDTEHNVIEEAEELRVCDVCRQEKSASAFVANSTRCHDCHEEMVQKVASYLG